MIPLFEHFPMLEKTLPYIHLCELPTPIFKLEHFGQEIGLQDLYVKQDGLTAHPFGGNKIRKLEFLLADAIAGGFYEVLTFGYAGSNHALATAIYAEKLGLKSISMLIPQPNAYYVQRNLLTGWYHNAEFHFYPDRKKMLRGAWFQKWIHLVKTGKNPYVIPPGGSNPLGIIGFINAAFELKNQIDSDDMPEPDHIYVPLGTAGTATGLLIGLKALGLKTRVTLIRIIEPHIISTEAICQLFRDTVRFLRKNDFTFPNIEISPEDFDICDNYLGNGYAHFTPEGNHAISLMKKNEAIPLDGTYTGKTLAALIGDAKSDKLRGKVVLFWNTLNSNDLLPFTENADYKNLPGDFHQFWDTPVQPLDLKEDEED